MFKSGAPKATNTWTCSNESRGGHEDAQRAGPPLLWRLTETVKAALPGEEKGSERPYSTLHYQKRLQEIWRGTLERAWSDGTKTTLSERELA